MPAHRCLTAWKEPIGRPNCCLACAYSAAVRLHQAAIPDASATASTASRSVTSPGSGLVEHPVGRDVDLDRDVAERAREVHRLARRDLDLVGADQAPGLASADRQQQVRRVAGPSTRLAVPVSRRPPSSAGVDVRSVGGSPTATDTSPEPIPASGALVPSRGSASAASSVGRIGPGARQAASCSATTATSVLVPPPSSAGSAIESTPSSASADQFGLAQPACLGRLPPVASRPRTAAIVPARLDH